MAEHYRKEGEREKEESCGNLKVISSKAEPEI